MNARAYWLLCVGAGLGVIVLGQILLPKFPVDGAGDAPGYGTPVYAFEMARTVDDLQAVFGMPGDPARPARIAAMDDGTKWDFVFLLAYGAFIATFFLAIHKVDQRPIWLFSASLGGVAAGADAVENLILLGIMADLEAAAYLNYLPYPVWVKFLSIMIAGICAGSYLIRGGRAVSLLLGTMAVIGSLTVLAAFYDGASFGWMVGSGITVCWLVQFGYAVRQTLGPRSAG